MDGVRHRQSYGNVLSKIVAGSSQTAPRSHPAQHSSHHHSSSALSRGVDTSHQQQSSSRHPSVIQHQQSSQQQQRPHPLQHSASTVTGVAGARRESREARRSISIPVIGDNRSGGKIISFIILV